MLSAVAYLGFAQRGASRSESDGAPEAEAFLLIELIDTQILTF